MSTPIERPGAHTDQSLTELLGVAKDDAASVQLREDLERIREAERAARRYLLA